MQNNSIKKALPRMARRMVLILILLILPANIWLQMYLQHQSQKESANDVFWQMQQLIERNEEELQQEKEDFSLQCIQAAKLAAYFVQHDIELVKDLAHIRELAEKMNVDEIHFFTPEGEIYSGTHPNYYGYTFQSGEQMQFFLPMLTDKTIELCQDITLNTAEGKPMQYAAVWMQDGTGIVQIGMRPERVLQEIKNKNLESVLAGLPMELQGFLHIVEKESGRIIASTAERMMGQMIAISEYQNIKNTGLQTVHYRYEGEKYCVYTQPYKHYLLVRSYQASYLLKSMMVSTVTVFMYMIFASIAVISMIVWYVRRKLSNNLMYIVGELKKIEQGNLENLFIRTGIQEFDELIFYINQLQQSIRLNWERFSHMTNKGRIPIGIFEDNKFYGKQLANKRMVELLGLETEEREVPKEMLHLIRHKLEELEDCMVDQKEKICIYERNGKAVYFYLDKQDDEQSTMYYVSDVTQWWNEVKLLREQNNHDTLTHLYNRRGFGEELQRLFQNPGQIGYAAMLMLDADGLKLINDTYGHRQGDRYLWQISNMLETAEQEHSLAARLGGDEFALFLYGYDSKEKLQREIQALKGKRGEGFLDADGIVNVSVEFSVGYAYYPEDGRDYHTLMHLADESMYQDKRKRKEQLFQ